MTADGKHSRRDMLFQVDQTGDVPFSFYSQLWFFTIQQNLN